MKFFGVFAAVCVGLVAAQGRNGDQNPQVWDALDVLRGRNPLSIPEIQELYVTAVAGKDYPLNSVIPQPDGVDKNTPGYFADQSTQCQGFHRVDLNGEITSYLCPNQTLFNQITLICDWFYNIDCAKSAQFIAYSNSRLVGDNLVLLDTQEVYEVQQATGASAGIRSAPAAAPPVAASKPKSGRAKSGARKQ